LYFDVTVLLLVTSCILVLIHIEVSETSVSNARFNNVIRQNVDLEHDGNLSKWDIIRQYFAMQKHRHLEASRNLLA